MFTKGLKLESQSGNIPKVYPQQNEYIHKLQYVHSKGDQNHNHRQHNKSCNIWQKAGHKITPEI